MRYFLLSLAIPVLALDNAARITDVTGSTQTGRPILIFWQFAKDEICDYPRPFTNGTAVTPWQSDIATRWPASAACPGGSVQQAYVSLRTTIAANATVTVDFRNSADRCSSGNDAACNAAALDQSGMLGFNGGAWDVQMNVSASPAGSTTTRTPSARSMLAGGHWRYLLRGPVLTRVRAADASTSRSQAFGWKERWVTTQEEFVTPSATSILVGSAADWASLPRPFDIQFGEGTSTSTEIVSICYVDVAANRLYIGTTAGTSPSCASTAGRAQDGTTAQNHSLGYYGKLLYANPATRVNQVNVSPSTHTITLTDASMFNAATVVRINGEYLRICNRSGNTVTVGTAAWPCAAGDANGHRYYGTTGAHGNGDQLYHQPQHFVWDWENTSDWWSDASSDKSKPLNPQFELDFWTGWAGVGAVYMMDNVWTDRQQDQEYDVTFRKGPAGSTSVATVPGVRHIRWTRWRWPVWNVNDSKTWDGATPGEVRVDFNLRYKKYAGILPHDPNNAITQTAIDNELTINTYTSNGFEPAWDNGDKCGLETRAKLSGQWKDFNASMIRYMNAPGGRPEIALFPRWVGSAAGSWSSSLPNAKRLNEVILGMAACTGYLPIHFVETDTTRKFCNGGSYPADTNDKSCTGSNQLVSAFGKPLSIDARPTVVGFDQFRTTNTAEWMPYPGGSVSRNFFAINIGAHGHLPEPAFGAFLMTGDEWLRESIQQEGAYALHSASHLAYYNANETVLASRAGQRWIGWIPYPDGLRGHSWATRNLGFAAYVSIDGSPEKQYFEARLNRLIAMEEGKFNITNGSFYLPCPAPFTNQYDHSPWCHGRTFKGHNAPNPTYSQLEGGGLNYTGFQYPGWIDPQKVFAHEPEWHNFGYWQNTLGLLESLGFTQIRPLRTTVQKRLLWALNGKDGYNPFLVAKYVVPSIPCAPEGTSIPGGCPSQTVSYGSSFLYSGFAAIRDAFTSGAGGAGSPTRFCGDENCTNSNDNDLSGGYSRLAFAGASWLPDGVNDGAMTGWKAWDWMRANIRYQNTNGDNPQWTFSPPAKVLITNVRRVDSHLYLSAPSGAACTYAINPDSTLDSSDTVATGLHGREQRISLSGVTAGSVVRITCGVARVHYVVP